MNGPNEPESIGGVGYSILSRLSLGVHARVLLVECPDGSRGVLKQALASNPAGRAHLIREARCLLDCQHPGVVRVVDHDLDSDTPWFLMPELRPGPWQVEGRLRPLPSESPGNVCAVADASSVRLQLQALQHLADTLAWLHGIGITHRDLKPSNVRMDQDGYPVLIDFDLHSRRAGQRDLMHEVNGLTGTVGFRSPEQQRGELGDARVDLFALGSLLLLTLTGSHVGTSFGRDAHQRLKRELTARTDVRSELRTLLLHLVEPEATHRLGFADHAAHILRSVTGVHSRVSLPHARPYLFRPALCGRESIVRQLNHELTSAASGRSNLVLLSGVSGSGKTRLLQTLSDQAHSGGFRVSASTCESAGLVPGGTRSNVPALQGFRHFLDQLWTEIADNPALESLLRTHAPILAPFAPSLANWLHDDDTRCEVAPSAVASAVLSLLHCSSAGRPTLLVIDDAQWADELTMTTLLTLAQTPWLAPSCLVALALRSDETRATELLNAQRTCTIGCDALDLHSVEALMSSMLGGTNELADVSHLVYERSLGSPFVVTSYVDHLVACGILQRREGRWLGHRVLDEVSAYKGFSELVEQRLTSLSADAAALCAAASVIGKCFDLRVAAEVANLGHKRTECALQELYSQRIVEADRDWSIRFTHDQFLEHAYAKIEPESATILHSRAGALLERVPSTSSLDLARHTLAARDAEGSLTHVNAAAEAASSHGRYGLASQLLNELHVLLDHSSVRLTQVQVARLALNRVKAVMGLRDFGAAYVVIEQELRALNAKPPTRVLEWLLVLAGAVLAQLWLRLRGAKNRTATSVEPIHQALAHLHHALSVWAMHNSRALPWIVSSTLAANHAEQARDWRQASLSSAALGFLLSFLRLRSLANHYYGLSFRWAQKSGDIVAEMHRDTSEAMHLIQFDSPHRAYEVASRLTRTCLQRGARYELVNNVFACMVAAWVGGKMSLARMHVQQLRELGGGDEFDKTFGLGQIASRAIELQDGDLHVAHKQALEDARKMQETASPDLQACAFAIAALAAARLRRFADAEREAIHVEQLLPDGGARTAGAYMVHQTLPEALILIALAKHDGPFRAHWLNKAKRAARAAKTHARMRPLLHAMALFHGARVAQVEGRISVARRLAARSMRVAERRQLPFELAQAQALLSALENDQGLRCAELKRDAEAGFLALGCTWHSEQLRMMEGTHVDSYDVTGVACG